MSGSKSVAVSGGGGDWYRAPFTAVQWQELEHQALIYKYLVAGVPVPSDLVLPIRRSLEALSAKLLHHPALGYTNLSLYYGKKFDPEPGRCRRTDGKKWRCSKEAFHESKYCERHMNRGRNRSRKPVESQSTAKGGSYQNVISTATVSATAKSLYPITTNSGTGSYNFGNNGSKLQLDTHPYGTNTKDRRYAQEQTVTVNVDNQNYTSNLCGDSNGNGNDLDNSWSSQVVTNSSSLLSEPQNDSYSNTFEPMIDDDANNSISMSSSKQHFCFFGDQVNHDEQDNAMLPIPWSNLNA
ncbi:unnamed protein product [Lactuca virosa]|uniref:Growth-regulating factor n=1 Tax=Lactuca virosa TaxID=75947 RepID=A0AAU9PP32_9ASTR|nr:unnamed protein product [Lactuca virosa]